MTLRFADPGERCQRCDQMIPYGGSLHRCESESLVSVLNDELRALRSEVADKDAEIQRLQQDLELADLTIDRYSRGLM